MLSIIDEQREFLAEDSNRGMVQNRARQGSTLSRGQIPSDHI